jgi:small conductance mechanosensitive channel
MPQLWQSIVLSFSEYWQEAVHCIAPVGVRVLAAVLLAAAALAAGRAARRASRRALEKGRASPDAAFLLPHLAYYGILLLGASLVLGLFGMSWSALIATVGFLGLVAGLAFQDVAKNYVAGMYLLLERPFRPGDRLKVKDFEGTVEDVTLRVTHLRGDEGQTIIVPNATIFTEVVVKQPEVKTEQMTVSDPPAQRG